ncbi:hypothetical protein GCM10007190_06950 [Macrococcus hajekii]|nr:hypothetical protein [Macrococcus hajekii]GGB01497.1 hypothetical protein GCM10007190_06950 [Macrococcus hajekii]
MTLTRNLRLPNLEHWYMYPGSVYAEEVYQYTHLEVYIWETDDIYILTITDLPENDLYSNEELISDIESLAHHLVIEKGSTQIYECFELDMSDFHYDPESEDTVECQIREYRDARWYNYVSEYIYPKYPLEDRLNEQKTFQY